MLSHVCLCIYIAGLDMASVLIQRVTDLVQAQHPSVRVFSTLSPVPQCCEYYHSLLLSHTRGQSQGQDSLARVCESIPPAAWDRHQDEWAHCLTHAQDSLRPYIPAASPPLAPASSRDAVLIRALDWLTLVYRHKQQQSPALTAPALHPQWVEAMRGLTARPSVSWLLRRLLFHYITAVKQPGTELPYGTCVQCIDSNMNPRLTYTIDPVARFHLRNGALLYDISGLGTLQLCSCMHLFVCVCIHMYSGHQ